MLSRPTLFIIGAGAGKDIEMPLGDDLATAIADRVNIRFNADQERVGGTDLSEDAIRCHARQVREKPNDYFVVGRQIAQGLPYAGSIDGYLHRHLDNRFAQVCGKIGIVQTILESEKTSAIYLEPSSREFRIANLARKSWMHAFVALLQEGIVRRVSLDQIFDNLAVISFNYDRCLEHFLFHALQSLFHLNEAEAAGLLNSKLRILRPYGKVAPLPWENAEGVGFGSVPSGEELASLWKNIRTFNEEIADGSKLSALGEAVSAARRIIFLGCHFHEQNMRLLQAAQPASGGTVNVYATAIYRSHSEIGAIEARIRQMLEPRGGTFIVQLDAAWDCSRLFQEFGMLWSR